MFLFSSLGAESLTVPVISFMIRFPDLFKTYSPDRMNSCYHRLNKKDLSLTTHYSKNNFILCLYRERSLLGLHSKFEKRRDCLFFSSLHRTFGFLWDTHDVVRAFYCKSKLKDMLIITALYPGGLEAWCQVLGDAWVGVRQTFYPMQNLLAVVGVQVALDEVSLALMLACAAFCNITSSLFVTAGRRDFNVHFTIQKLLGLNELSLSYSNVGWRCLFRWHLNSRVTCTLSTGVAVRDVNYGVDVEF